MYPKLPERAVLEGGGLLNSFSVPARVVRTVAGMGSETDQAITAGGGVTFIIRNSSMLKEFLKAPSGVNVTFKRWNKGVIYSVSSALPEFNGRLLRCTARVSD